MPKKSTKYYWWCQFGGWSLVGLSMLFFAHTFEQKVSAYYLVKILSVIAGGILSTHLLRAVIKKNNWLLLPIEKVLPKLFIAVIITSLFFILLQMGINQVFNLTESKRKLDFTTRLLANILNIGIFIVPWVMIYYFYHYIEKKSQAAI